MIFHHDFLNHASSYWGVRIWRSGCSKSNNFLPSCSNFNLNSVKTPSAHTWPMLNHFVALHLTALYNCGVNEWMNSRSNRVLLFSLFSFWVQEKLNLYGPAVVLLIWFKFINHHRVFDLLKFKEYCWGIGYASMLPIFNSKF